jgi:hypothetical protein
MKASCLLNSLMFSAILLTAGCAPKQTAATTEQKPRRWQYHVERFKSGSAAERSKLIADSEKVPSAEWKTRMALNDEAMGMFFPDSKIDELGEIGWEMVGCYVEPETVWPNINEHTTEPVSRQPNFRGGQLVLIFKRAL